MLLDTLAGSLQGKSGTTDSRFRGNDTTKTRENTQTTTSAVNTGVPADQVQFSGYFTDRKTRKETEALTAAVLAIKQAFDAEDKPPVFKFSSSRTQRGLVQMITPVYIDGDTEIYGDVSVGGKTYKAYLCHSSRQNVRGVRLQSTEPGREKEELWVHWDLCWDMPRRMVLRNLPCRLSYTNPKGKRIDRRFFGEDENYQAMREEPAIKAAVELGYTVRKAIAESKSGRFRDKPEDTIVG